MRSEELVDRMGQNIRSFAALSWQRTQEAARRVALAPTGIGPGQDMQSNQPEGEQVERTPQAEMQKAERLVDDMAQRLALLASKAGLQTRRMAAYAREGAEDMWVEAQHIRSGRISQ
jgi:hypothetical protein